MKDLKRQEYKRFIEVNILRPYQGMIFDGDKAGVFTNDFYNSIPELVENNEEWATCVFNRISRIYDAIDGDYFPQGRTAMVIVSALQAHGVNVRW